MTIGWKSARRFGATATVNSGDGSASETVMNMTGGQGVDTAIEAVGIPATFELCEQLVAAGGIIANIGVHGMKVDLIWRSFGTATSPSPRDWWIPSARRCC